MGRSKLREHVVPGLTERIGAVTKKSAGQSDDNPAKTQREVDDGIQHVPFWIARVARKQPPDSHVWVLGGAAPAFVKFEGPLYQGRAHMEDRTGKARRLSVTPC